MTYGIYVAAAGAVARRSQIDIVANNVANSDTRGFRGQIVAFEEVLRDAEAPSRHTVALSTIRTDGDKGRLEATARPSDFALAKRGFVEGRDRHDGTVLIRTARLSINDQGWLVDERDHAMVDSSGSRITLDPRYGFELSEDGEVSQRGSVVGRLVFRDVMDEGAMERAGDGAFMATQSSGAPYLTRNELVIGYLEGSNVKPLEGMVSLIRLERGHQANLKVIQAYRDADEQLIEEAGR